MVHKKREPFAKVFGAPFAKVFGAPFAKVFGALEHHIKLFIDYL